MLGKQNFWIILAAVLCYAAAATIMLLQPVMPSDEPHVVPADLGEHRVLTLAGDGVELHELWQDRPTLVVTTSLTCPVSRASYPRFRALAERYQGVVDCMLVYTLEAHPTDAPAPYPEPDWVREENAAEGIACGMTRTWEERAAYAKDYVERFDVKEPLYLDAMSDQVWKALGKRPNSAVLVDERGRLVEHQEWFDDLAMTRILRDRGIEPVGE